MADPAHSAMATDSTAVTVSAARTAGSDSPLRVQRPHRSRPPVIAATNE